jgi:hypothetical protein
MRSIAGLPKLRHLLPTFCDTSPSANSLEPDLSADLISIYRSIYLSRRCQEERDPAQDESSGEGLRPGTHRQTATVRLRFLGPFPTTRYRRIRRALLTVTLQNFVFRTQPVFSFVS